MSASALSHLCLSCLGPNNLLKDFKLKSRCKKCHSSHHTLLEESGSIVLIYRKSSGLT